MPEHQGTHLDREFQSEILIPKQKTELSKEKGFRQEMEYDPSSPPCANLLTQ